MIRFGFKVFIIECLYGDYDLNCNAYEDSQELAICEHCACNDNRLLCNQIRSERIRG